MWLWTDMCVDQSYAVPQGYDIFTTYNGIVGQAYCRKYGMSPEDYDHGMFELCRTRRLHGSMNPKAIIQETLDDEATRHGFDDPYAFWQSRLNPYISWPARYRSVVTPADGASAMVLVRTEAAKGLASAPVRVRGFGTAVSDMPWYDADPTDWKVDRVAFANAFEMAGIKAKDIDYLHTHDCSHIMGICMAETMGYLEPGTGLKAAEEGRLRFDGDRPMSTHGGRHAFGHAWAASAGADTYEAVKQLRGEAGERQIPTRPEIAVVATHGYAMISHTVVLQGS
jgi:acetyl-CoA C-acetyltransferase